VESTAQKIVKKDSDTAPPKDWRESWGKLKDATPPPTAKAEKKTKPKTEVAAKPEKAPASKVKSEKTDPLGSGGL